jgi:hypothetical protein
MPGAEMQDETDRQLQRSSAPPPTPRWVKISVAVALLVVLLLLAVLLLGGGKHGPGRHGGGSTVVLATP